MKISDPTVSSAAVPVLGESEYRFACIVWQNEPLPSGRLVQLCAQQLGWKKSTTYTVLKNLIHKGLLQNEGGTVTKDDLISFTVDDFDVNVDKKYKHERKLGFVR